MVEPSTPHLAKIIAGETLESSDEICRALREILPEAEKWVGRDFALVCDQHGWLIRYSHGHWSPDLLLDRHGYPYACAEDAIQALVGLIARNKGEAERENDDAA